MDQNDRRRVCELVAGLIAADDELKPEELTFLLKAFAAFGVVPRGEDVAIAPRVAAADARRAMRELPESVRATAIDMLVACALADGEVVDAERRYLIAVAEAASISAEEIDARITAAIAAHEARS